MISAQFYKILSQSFPFSPTYKQDIFFQQIAEFITNENQDEIFVLKGYAGTGKTTVISNIVNNLVDKFATLMISSVTISSAGSFIIS